MEFDVVSVAGYLGHISPMTTVIILYGHTPKQLIFEKITAKIGL